MKIGILIIALSCCIGFVSCVEKETDALFTQITLTVVPPENIRMERFQATMIFENINTRQRTSTSDFHDGVLDIRLLQGVYRLSIAEGGGMTYVAEGKTLFSEVVIDNTPVNLLERTMPVSVDLILKNTKE